MSTRTTTLMTAAAGVGSAIALIAHFAVAAPPASFTSQPALQEWAGHHAALLTSAWLDGVGSTLLVVTLVAIAGLAGSLGSLAGRILLLAGSAVIAHSLLSDTLLIAAAQTDAAGNAAMAVGAVQLLHAADYAFPIVNAFWGPALGAVVLRTRILPAVFGYVALAFGAVELLGGLAALFSDAVNAVVNPFFMVMLAWSVAAGIVLALRAFRTPDASSESRVAAAPAR